MNRNLKRTYNLIEPQRKRAVLRKCFDRINDIVSKKECTAAEVLKALQALDLVLGLAQPQNGVEKLAEALTRPDDLNDDRFWPEFEKIMEERRKYAEKIQN